MSFFSSMRPSSGSNPAAQPRPIWMQPDGVIPGSVPGELLLIRTENAAVSVGEVCAYPNGFEFTAHVRVRSSDAGQTMPFGIDPFDRFGRHGAETTTLRLGILYSDGRRGAVNGWPADAGDFEAVMVMPGSSGGSDRRWDGKFWVHPLPPEGPVTIVAAWLKHQVAETRVELDGDAIRAAAARAVTLWPEESGPSGPSFSGMTSRKVDDPDSEAEPNETLDLGTMTCEKVD
jgi:hypothetical protein